MNSVHSKEEAAYIASRQRQNPYSGITCVICGPAPFGENRKGLEQEEEKCKS